MVRVHFINNDGGGFNQAVDVNDRTTIAQFLVDRGITDASRYTIRRNGQTVRPEELLQSGDNIEAYYLRQGELVTVAPKNVGGAN